jgi:outer membrane receptor protein involved in Fe transport
VGLTYTYSAALNLFGGYSESFRAPTPAELTCADPDDPCNLPNAFVAEKHAELWARVDNVFDTDYETGRIRNFNAFADPIDEERFLAPGAPRAGWVGVKLRF